MSDFTTARSIALNWLDGVSPLDEGMLRQAAEIASQAVNSRPGADVDLEVWPETSIPPRPAFS